MIINVGDRERERAYIYNHRRAKQFGIMFMIAILVIFAVLTFIIDGFFLSSINLIKFTVQKYELWRISTSFLIPGVHSLILMPLIFPGGYIQFSSNKIKFFSMVQFIFCIYFLAKVSWLVERTYSTAYLIINCFLQVIFSNIILVLIYYPLMYFNVIGDDHALFSGVVYVYGSTPLIINLLFQILSIDGKATTKILFFDCQINYYIVLALFIIIISLIQGIILAAPISPIFVYLILSFYQYLVRKQLFFKLPLSFYKAFDCIIPSKLYQSNQYTKAVNAQENLKKICFSCCNCCYQKNQTVNNYLVTTLFKIKTLNHKRKSKHIGEINILKSKILYNKSKYSINIKNRMDLLMNSINS